MKKSVWAVLFVFLILNLAGCATVQKKFTRKKKEKYQPAVIYLEETTYQKKFSNDYYYKTHYTMWRTWHDELIKQLGGNSKKLSRCAQETYNHLVEMNRYLNPDKQAQLKPILDSVSQITRKIDAGNVSSAEIGTVRAELEKERRLIANDFYYDKVKDALVPDVVDLGASPSPVTPAESQPA
jgi:uncharacterized protein YceK